MKSIFETNGGTYRNENGYLIPNLSLPDELEYQIGIWGRRRHEYLKNHRKGIFAVLLTTGKLHEHLQEINIAACERKEIIVEQMMKAQGVTEKLKAENPQKWIGLANNIRASVDEIIYNELIYS